MDGDYRYNKDFYDLSDIPILFLQQIDRTLNCPIPVWPDDTILVTKGDKERHGKNYSKYWRKSKRRSQSK